MKRRLLLTADVDANKYTCGSCRYLQPGPKCGLFTGLLEISHVAKPLRAEECVDAEARAVRDA